jgi:hypothetical protein
MVRLADHPDGIWPLASATGPVRVDGHPICVVCGRAVQPVGPDRWRHVPKGRPFPSRPRWLSPITPGELRGLPTYADFAARYPWAVRPELAGAPVTSPEQWREGVRRLERYDQALRAVGHRRRLRAGENPYLDLACILATPSAADPAEAGGALLRLPDWGLARGLAQVLNLRARRRELAALFAWAIPSDDGLACLARYAPLVECGAGTGYWTALLRARGVDVLAYDQAPPGGGPRGPRNEYHNRARRPWTEVVQASSLDAVRRNPQRALFLCWPPYGDDAASYAVLRAYRGDLLVYVGGGSEGADGSVRFHRELALNWTPVEALDLPHWPRLPDRVTVCRRNPAHRPLRERDRCDECQRFVRTGSIGRCERCFQRHPPAVAVRVGEHRVEYSAGTLQAMPPALRRAIETSRHRIR